MPSIRSLRLSRGMTLVELALAAGVPARTLGAIEYGLLCLDPDSAARLAGLFGLPPDQLCAAAGHLAAPRRARGRMVGLRRTAPPLIAALISGLLLTRSPLAYRLPAAVPPSANRPAAPAAAPAPAPPPPPARAGAAAVRQPAPLRLNTSVALAAPTAPPSPPLPTPTSTFRIADDGPHGCPLVAPAGRVVITQGYGEGSHAPAAIWGALDLAIDGDGDGYADPGATDGVTIVATHDGVAHVYPNSWPGGNFVLLANAQAGWSTAYAHLGSIAVVDGQAVAAGALLGTVGSTGMATGPHLHYEVRHGGVNLDPSGLIECEAR